MRLFALFFVQRLADASPPWRFDFLSALIGAAVALLLTGLLYTFRDVLNQVWEAVLRSLRRLWHYLLAGAEESYREQVIAWARSLIIPPTRAVSLDAIFIEPELRVPPPAPRSISEVEAYPDPLILPLHRILGGYSRLIILGAAGTGRTTLLAYLALVSARMEEGEAVPPVLQGRLPLYVSLPLLAWDEPEAEKDAGTAKLIGAAIAAIGGGSGLAAPLRKYLESGKAIVLADGWDELSQTQRQQVSAWLTELSNTLPDNLWLVAAGMRDYAPLTEAGFVPLTLAEWHIKQAEALAQRWLEVYTPEGESPPVPLRELMADLRKAARLGYPPLELSLLAFVHLTDRQPPPRGRTALFDRALELLLGQDQKHTQEEAPTLVAACRAALGQVALMLQQENRTTASREEIEAAIETALPPPEERPAQAVPRVFRMLTGEHGLLRRVSGDQYTFIHSLWQAYLAARQLVAVSPAPLLERLEDPRWADVLRFYAALGDMRPLVAAWLRAPDDMFYTRLCTLSAWVGAAPEGTAWRDGAMAVLARTLVQPGRLPTRRALAEALATSGVSGVGYFLKQALQHPNADVRIAALTGLARVADEADLPAFEAALRDAVPAVREAAVRALAAFASDAAIRLIEHALLEGDDALRLTAAEMLAKCGDEGVAFLHEMIESEDVVIRRAAVVGLGLVGARDVLERVAREDEQWIVRSAAESAIDALEKRKASGIAAPAQVDQLPWLISWAASRGEGVGLGEAARLTLRRALNEGDTPIRLAAAQTLAQVGRPDDVDALRTALADPDRDLAHAAFEALAEIGQRYNLKIE